MTKTLHLTDLNQMFYEIIKNEFDGYEILVMKINDFNEHSIDEILNEVELKTGHLNKKLRKRTFFVSVELLQNLYRHAYNPFTEENSNNKLGFYVLSKKNDSATKIGTGNFVTLSQKQHLDKYLNKLKSLTLPELKELYFDILENKPRTHQGGSGLGFLEIAKKTSKNFDFKFLKYNLETYFFIYTATITIEN